MTDKEESILEFLDRQLKEIGDSLTDQESSQIGELKPCPFCGGDAIVREPLRGIPNPYAGEKCYKYSIYCQECTIGGNVLFPNMTRAKNFCNKRS